MKKAFQIFAALMLVLTVAASAVFAESAQGPGKGAKRFERLAQKLNLTADQQAKLKPIAQNYQQQRKAEREASRAKFQSVLTPEQKTKFEQMKADRKNNPGKPEPGMRKKMAEELGLTPEQQEQLKAYHQENRDKMKAEREAFVAQVKTILTPQQQAQLTQMMARKHGQRSKNQGTRTPEAPDRQPEPGSPFE